MVVMRQRGGAGAEEVSPPGVSVRSRVHEYGGGAHFAEGDDLLYTALDDQALWWLAPGTGPVRLTPPASGGESHRYADARPVAGGRFVVAVREHHHDDAVDDEVVAVDRLGLVAPAVLARGRDFFASPRPSPDGRLLAWLAWDHPNMAWDGCELWVAELELPAADPPGPGRPAGGEPRLTRPRCLAGGPTESVGQPTWAGGDLWFVSDRFGWWQPFRSRRGGEPERLVADEVEFAGPAWVLGQTTLATVADGRALCWFHGRGRDRVGLVDPTTATISEVEQPCVAIAEVGVVEAGAGPGMVVLGSTPSQPAALYRVTPGSEPGAAPVVEEIHRPLSSVLAPAWISEARELSFPTAAGVPASLLFLAPPAPGWAGPQGELPPLVVVCHGGPTSAVRAGYDAEVQLWTTRGVAVALVDYRGSTGHGREFRRLLDGAWGSADAEDCRAAAAFLVDAGLVDGRRMVVKGSSAGGLTALRCLDAGGPFAAAVVAYGVTDLAALAADTHKFESRYTDRLVGPWPEAADVYAERSPARHPERVEGAVLLLQGLEDPIVPPDQAERMVAALRARRLRCDHVVFPGEGHGFRRAETLVRCAELEIAFVTDVLGLGQSH